MLLEFDEVLDDHALYTADRIYKWAYLKIADLQIREFQSILDQYESEEAPTEEELAGDDKLREMHEQEKIRI